MARPPDPRRREQTLARATDYVFEHGLAGLSLRPLAKALGTSTRMLLYDFGSKEALINEVLAEARRRQAQLLAQFPPATLPPRETLQAIWEWIADEQRVPYVRLFFEVYIDAIRRPEAYPASADAMVTDWIQAFATALGTDDHATATLAIATIRGLLLDLLLTHDKRRTNQALSRLAQTLEN